MMIRYLGGKGEQNKERLPTYGPSPQNQRTSSQHFLLQSTIPPSRRPGARARYYTPASRAVIAPSTQNNREKKNGKKYIRQLLMKCP